MLFGLLALVCAAIAAYLFYSIRGQADTSIVTLVLGGLFVLLTIVFGVMFMTKRVNKTEDIHVTE
ncbi:MAG: hypothetical protein HKN33_06810 [Pyrinomonadaceae bacterium]|nr:hypothetical protein [Pyrinomonadaceae bacterium]